MRGVIAKILLFIFVFSSFAARAEGVDVKEVVLGHIGDSYDWHITTIGEKHISIPLPVIESLAI